MNPIIKQTILVHVKLSNRHTKLVFLFVPLLVYVFLLPRLKGAHVDWLDTPYLASVLCLLTFGMLFVNLFLGIKDEGLFYAVLPTDFRKVVMAKNLATLLVALPLSEVVIITAAVSFGFSSHDVIDASLYILSVFFVLLHFGNSLAVRIARGKISGNPIVMSWIHALLIAAASIPFALLKLLSDSYVPIMAFIAFLALTWYWYSLPRTARLLHRHKVCAVKEHV